jgi:hypothetical protein
MYIVLVGNPFAGYTACGPFDTNEEAELFSDLACTMFAGSGSDSFTQRLKNPSPAPRSRTAKEWRAAGDAWIHFTGTSRWNGRSLVRSTGGSWMGLVIPCSSALSIAWTLKEAAARRGEEFDCTFPSRVQ